ncbi:hypothetical protein BDR05DRAFT_949039 [Suillus weaverae]|nr:hypothetical protein BDR05DRAFT_949039 [Suillus weaverae]
MSNSQNASSTMAQTSLRGPRMSGTSNEADIGGLSSSQHDLVEKCLSIVKDYKHTIISKSEAYVSITKAVSTATNEATDQAESFITSPYFNMLDEWARGLDRGRNQWDSDATTQCSEVRESVPPRENEHQQEPSVERDEPLVHVIPASVLFTSYFRTFNAGWRHYCSSCGWCRTCTDTGSGMLVIE